ncbi:MAG: nucleotidyl transferase AbiEii/AbiGii toxin family protein [Fimbriimonadaceae bacterium]|nr:nucleotidyl transferase AbiEii/AbiGii toxin family protein [Fimbriimonadaceae bacterium]
MSQQKPPELRNAISLLDSAFTSLGLRYAIVGGTAVVLRGYDRATVDIDAVVLGADEHIGEIMDTFAQSGITSRVAEPISFAKRSRMILARTSAGAGIDVALGILPFEYELVEHADEMALTDELTVPVATAEDLMIMKLIASRDRDLDDIQRLLEIHPQVDKARIRRVVTEFAELLESEEVLENLARLFPKNG